jgi:hypothetical protein
LELSVGRGVFLRGASAEKRKQDAANNDSVVVFAVGIQKVLTYFVYNNISAKIFYSAI